MRDNEGKEERGGVRERVREEGRKEMRETKEEERIGGREREKGREIKGENER